jgi:RND family efflux transporter MFP subunit
MSDDAQHYNPLDHEPLPEGEEAPPPYVHTMAIIRWVILGALSLFALVMVLNYFGATPWAATTTQSTQYHCPMHPTYVSNQPGECPICGMSLVPINAEGKEVAKPDSMKMTSAETMSADSMPRAKPGQYTCPMDPEIISDKPARCPKCGMKLVQVSPSTAAGTAMPGMSSTPAEDHPSSTGTVPGLVSVTIEPERLQLIGLRTMLVERRSLEDKLRLAGYVTSDETRTANVQVRVSGWVKKLFVDQTGQYVKVGQPLLSIYSQELAQAQQDLIVARQAVDKAASDSEMVALREQLLSSARTRLQLLGLSARDIETQEKTDTLASELILRSPATGYVMEKNVLQGQYVGPDQNLFTIADLSRIWVLADVYEQDLASVNVGQKALMRLSALPGEEFAGTVGFIYPTISEKTRTLKVRLEFADSGGKLRPGMYADVEIDKGGEPVLAVPTEAVMDGGETRYAFVVHDRKHFEPRLLTLGNTTGDWVEVISGLSEGDEVVTSANFLIDSESRLKAAISGMGGTKPNEHAGHDK